MRLKMSKDLIAVGYPALFGGLGAAFAMILTGNDNRINNK